MVYKEKSWFCYVIRSKLEHVWAHKQNNTAMVELGWLCVDEFKSISTKLRGCSGIPTNTNSIWNPVAFQFTSETALQVFQLIKTSIQLMLHFAAQLKNHVANLLHDIFKDNIGLPALWSWCAWKGTLFSVDVPTDYSAYQRINISRTTYIIKVLHVDQ